MEKETEKLRGQMLDRLETVILDVTKAESTTAATQWVKEYVGDRVGELCLRILMCSAGSSFLVKSVFLPVWFLQMAPLATSLVGSSFDAPVSCPVMVHSLFIEAFHELCAQAWNQEPERTSLPAAGWLQ
ncbi:hypothetical protein HPG69_014960 [Diceros bicornis minor]|uniref:Uncharacterized protein n=1 Tax=Diceros bicornis minor TaxID=77932 RepID=A0A7J7FJW7_DICBM|nr:hypothetical protein HPG69_014960 [Diceros bicornis minor]